jgi:hypothetical protein
MVATTFAWCTCLPATGCVVRSCSKRSSALLGCRQRSRTRLGTAGHRRARSPWEGREQSPAAGSRLLNIPGAPAD